jgi:hypothetical protein
MYLYLKYPGIPNQKHETTLPTERKQNELEVKLHSDTPKKVTWKT